jgi:RNA polymerase sigma-70 factor (ECF subfamily)
VYAGDTEGLIELLAADVVAYTDGGGKVQAARKPLHGADRVARFLLGAARRGAAGLAVEPVVVNGWPGRLFRDPQGEPVAVLTLDVAEGLVQGINVVSNPDKLAHLRRA